MNAIDSLEAYQEMIEEKVNKFYNGVVSDAQKTITQAYLSGMMGET